MKLSILKFKNYLIIPLFFFFFFLPFFSKQILAQGTCSGGCLPGNCAGLSNNVTICCGGRSESSCKLVSSCGCTWTPSQPAPTTTTTTTTTTTQSCASGWQCGSACADSNTVASFTAVWCDPKGRWLFEAGQNLGISCGGNPSQQKSTGCGTATPAPTKPTPIPLAKSCSTKEECQSQCPSGTIFCGGSLNGCMPGTKTCETWVYELTGMTPQVQQAAAEQQRKQAEAAAAAQIANQEEINKALADTAGSCVDRKTQAPDPSCGALPNRYNCGQSPGCLWVSNRGSQTRPNNTPCTNNDQCQSGFCKYEGAYALCAPKVVGITSKPNGDSCSIGSNCISNFCSLVTKKCQDFYAPRAIGDTCATKANCASGLTCFNGLCATEQVKTQTITSEEEVCRNNGGAYCASDPVCVSGGIAACAGSGETCASACQKKQTRVDNSGGGDWTKTLKKEGETCAFDWECGTGRCRDLNGAKQCVGPDRDPTLSTKYRLDGLSCSQCTIAQTVSTPQACIYPNTPACEASDEFQKAKESSERALTNKFRIDGVRCIACSAIELQTTYKDKCIYSSDECAAAQTGKAQELSTRFKLVDGACFQCNQGEALANLCPFDSESSCKDSPTGLVYLDTSLPSRLTCLSCKVSDKGTKSCMDAVSCTDLINKTKETVAAQSTPTNQIDGDSCVKENGECLCTTPTCLCKYAPLTVPFIINQNNECANPNPPQSKTPTINKLYKFNTATNQCDACSPTGPQDGCVFSSSESCLTQESNKYFFEPTLKLCLPCLNSDLATPNKCVSENDCKSLLTSAPPTQSQEINGDTCDDRTGKCICSSDLCACKGTSPDGKVNAGTISKGQRCFNPYINKSDKPQSPLLGTKKLREFCENGSECETGICKLSSGLTKQCASPSDLGLKGAFCISSNQCLSGACDTTVQKCTGPVLTKKYIYPGEVCSPDNNYESCLCRTSSGLVKEIAKSPVAFCTETIGEINADRCDPLRGECTCKTDICTCTSGERSGKVYKGQDCYNTDRKNLNPASICGDNKCTSPNVCTTREKDGKVFAFCDRPGFEEDFYLVAPGGTCPRGVRACYCKNFQIGEGQTCPSDPTNGDFCGGTDRVCQASRCETGSQIQGNETGVCGELNKNFCCQNVSCFKFTNQTECLSNPACNWTTQSGKCFNLPFQVINDRRFAEAKNENPTKPVSLSACSDKCENPLGCNCNNIQCFGDITMGASCSQLPASDLYGGTQWIARQRTLMEKCEAGLVNPVECLLGWAYQVVDVPTLGGISGVNNSVQSVRKCQEDRDSGIRETNCAGEVASTAASGLFTAGDLIGLSTVAKNFTKNLIQRFSPAATINDVAKTSLKTQLDDLIDPALSFTSKDGKVWNISKEANKIPAGERARLVNVETKSGVFLVTEEEAAIAKAFRDSELTAFDKIKAQVQDIGQNISKTFNNAKEAQAKFSSIYVEEPSVVNPGVYNSSENVQIFKAFSGEEVKIPAGPSTKTFDPSLSFSDKAAVVNRLDSAGIKFKDYFVDGNIAGITIDGVTDPQRINEIFNRAAEGRPIYTGPLAKAREQAQDFIDSFGIKKAPPPNAPALEPLSQAPGTDGKYLTTFRVDGNVDIPVVIDPSAARNLAEKGSVELGLGSYLDDAFTSTERTIGSTFEFHSKNFFPITRESNQASRTITNSIKVAVENVNSTPGSKTLVFMAHGTPESIQIKGALYSPERFGDLMVDKFGLTSDTKIMLFSCQTGVACETGSFAERFANELQQKGLDNITIYAPKGNLTLKSTGEIKVLEVLPSGEKIPVEGNNFTKVTISNQGITSGDVQFGSKQ